MSATNVARAGKRGNICVGSKVSANNVSSFASTLSLQTTRMPCDFTLAVVFETSTSGRFVKLKTNKI